MTCLAFFIVVAMQLKQNNWSISLRLLLAGNNPKQRKEEEEKEKIQTGNSSNLRFCFRSSLYCFFSCNIFEGTEEQRLDLRQRPVSGTRSEHCHCLQPGLFYSSAHTFHHKTPPNQSRIHLIFHVRMDSDYPIIPSKTK